MLKHRKKQFIHVCCLFLLEHHLWTRHGHEYILSYCVLAVLPRHTLSVCALWRPRGRKWNVDSAILFVQVLAFGRCLSTVTHMSSRRRRGRRPAMMVNDATMPPLSQPPTITPVQNALVAVACHLHFVVQSDSKLMVQLNSWYFCLQLLKQMIDSKMYNFVCCCLVDQHFAVY